MKSVACLPGEKAAWIAQSNHASARAAGERPAVMAGDGGMHALIDRTLDRCEIVLLLVRIGPGGRAKGPPQQGATATRAAAARWPSWPGLSPLRRAMHDLRQCRGGYGVRDPVPVIQIKAPSESAIAVRSHQRIATAKRGRPRA